MQHPDGTKAGHRDGHLALGYRVHGRRGERHIQGDAARKARDKADGPRMREGVTRGEEHIVKCQREILTHSARRPGAVVRVAG